MNNTQRRHRIIAGVMVVLLVLISVKLWDYFSHLKKYEEMPSTAVETTVPPTTVPETETEPETEPEIIDPELLREIDFKSLKEKNEDVVGWIYIPDTVINYPVLWRKDDNNYYLRRDIDKREGSYDGIFMDGSDTPDMSQRQILFYGHHMKNGTMFTKICDYKEEDFFKEHRKVYFYTPDHAYALRTMACLYTDSSPEKRKVEFADQLEFDAYVNEMTKRCSFREIPEGGVEQIFSFVTCSYEFNDARTILYCYEVDSHGNPVRSTEAEEETSEAEKDKDSSAADKDKNASAAAGSTEETRKQ